MTQERSPWFADPALRERFDHSQQPCEGGCLFGIEEGIARADFLALLDIATAAEACVKTWLAHGYTHNHIPDALALSETLSRAAGSQESSS